MDCDTARRTILLTLYGEEEGAGRAECETHLASCEACRLAAAGERRLAALLAERRGAEPTDDLLARCRRDLWRALDAEPAPAGSRGRRAARFFLQARLSPAWGLVLVLGGFLAGLAVLHRGPWTLRGAGGPSPVAALDAAAASPVADILSLEASPDRDHVRVSYDTRRRASVEGSAADPAIRTLLVNTVRDSLNAGLRLEAIDALRRQTGRQEVRRALIGAVRDDDNPGARLRAIDALRDRVAADADVRRALLEALKRDANPGVRVRAVDALARARDPRMLPDLERLAREDPDTYVRLRSGALADALLAEDRR